MAAVTVAMLSDEAEHSSSPARRVGRSDQFNKRAMNGSQPLTPVLERFARAAAKATSPAAAYRKLHPKAKECTVHPNVSRLMKQSKVQTRIDYLRKRTADKASDRLGLTHAQWLKRFLRLADKSEKAKEYGNARANLREIGLATRGWYAPQNVEIAGDINMTVAEKMAKLRSQKYGKRQIVK
jgi:hypothetical protein